MNVFNKLLNYFSLSSVATSPVGLSNEFLWFIDEFLYFRGHLHIAGWAFHPQKTLQEIQVLLPTNPHRVTIENWRLSSPDVEKAYGMVAKNVRFRVSVPIEKSKFAKDVKLAFIFEEEIRLEVENLALRRIILDPYHTIQNKFFDLLKTIPDGGQVLELGSRARSGVVRRSLVSKQLTYTGMDIMAGENVDVVGDAHQMSHLFAKDTFDALFALSVFEHLLMPWKVVLELNHILKPGGIVLITTHQTWPLHDMPWDFWRFSDQAWHALFNTYTGFEIIEAVVGLPAAIVPHQLQPTTADLCAQPAYLGSAALCRKISDTALTWDVDLSKVVSTMYPA